MITLNCLQCGKVFMTATPRADQELEAFFAAWKLSVARNSDVFHCTGCGGAFRPVSDGIDAASGGSICLSNVSMPRIDSLTITSGARTGGEALYITGAALDVGTLEVKFSGRAVQAVTNRSATQARIVTPTGRYTFTDSVVLTKVALSSVTGVLSIGQSVTFSNGSKAVLRHSSSNLIHWVDYVSVVGGTAPIIGQAMTSPTGSGAIAAISRTPFIIGEGLRGLSSGARGAVVSTSPLTVATPTNAFTRLEMVTGDASGACARLSSPAYDGLVDVTVQNEYGQRQVGGTLAGGFTYL